MFVFLSIAKEGKHSNNQYTVTINTLSLANLILVKMLPHKHWKSTPFLFASALAGSIYVCAYLIFVIFLHEQNFWRMKFTPKKRVNYDKIHRKLPIFSIITA